ncbi:hypothetical protein BCR44DRAFT_58652 [Catenaria anguillulae PL171]|uniref:Uncharacterized protein n=1 Tax=Catenaria anguillulae PL171 TaxID=765915 RepID=A0A1Y2HPG0_9FUNG|nr:hypothetical protein BCR44DRAFT_58652 [Catenaria anguillulae PL171]
MLTLSLAESTRVIKQFDDAIKNQEAQLKLIGSLEGKLSNLLNMHSEVLEKLAAAELSVAFLQNQHTANQALITAQEDRITRLELKSDNLFKLFETLNSSMQKSAQVSKGISQAVSQCSDNINVHNIKIRTLSGDIITIKSMLSKLASATKQVPNAKAGCQVIDPQSFVVPSGVTLDAGSAFKNILLTNGRSTVPGGAQEEKSGQAAQ